MKRKLLLIALISSLFLTGCDTITENTDAGNGEVSEIVTEAVTEEAESTETEDADENGETDNSDNSASDEDQAGEEFRYFKVPENEEWNVDYSDPEDNYLSLVLKTNNNIRLYFEADDSGEYSKAVYLAGDNRAYCAEQSYEFLKNEKTDFYGTEAIHQSAASSEGDYYDYYFFDNGNGVIYKVTVSYRNGSCNENCKSTDNILKTAEFFCNSPSESASEKDEITMEDIIKANRLNNILSKYDSVKTETSVGFESYTIYADRECNGIYDLKDAEMQKGDMMCSMESGKFLAMYTFEPEIDLYEHRFFLDGMFDYFKITNVSNDGKKIKVTAEMNEYTSEAFFKYINMRDDNDGKAVATITLKSDDLAIEKLSVKSESGLSDKKLFSYKCSYNVQKNLKMKLIYDHMDTDEIRVLTGIVNPGKEDEYTVSWKGVKGDTIQFVDFHDSILTPAFEDRECKKQYNTGTDKDKNSDITFYAVNMLSFFGY